MGPVASQEAIKQLGTNGGGFFNANAAHPFENPNPLTNFLSMFLIFADPGGAHLHVRPHGAATRGRAGRSSARWPSVLRRRRGRLLGGGGRQPRRCRRWASTRALGNMEGKEVRFGVANSALFATVTTDASCGAVNSMHDSFTPLGGLVPLFNIQLGEVIFGGVGAGLYGMLVMAILSVFIAGLWWAARREYLGKKIETREVKLAMLYVLIFPLVILALHGLVRGRALRPVVAQQRGPARPQRDPLRVHQRGRQQRLRLRRHQRQHALVQHRARARHAHRPLLDDRARAGHRGLAGGQEGRRRPGPARCPPTGRCSSSCSSASS